VKLAIVCGLAEEADIIGQPPNAVVIVGAGNSVALSAKLETVIVSGADHVISVGIAGAINFAMQTGDVVIGVGALDETAAIACDPAWCNRIFDALRIDPPYRIGRGRLAWSAKAISRLADKAALRKATMADVVDEETFLAGSIATAHGLPWAALRVVCDPASFELPPAALVKLTAAGAADFGAILASIATEPWQIPEVLELAGLSTMALASLRAALTRVGPDFGASV
jgi:adenosylhomocysteine nucleosidase